MVGNFSVPLTMRGFHGRGTLGAGHVERCDLYRESFAVLPVTRRGVAVVMSDGDVDVWRFRVRGGAELYMSLRYSNVYQALWGLTEQSGVAGGLLYDRFNRTLYGGLDALPPHLSLRGVLWWCMRRIRNRE